MQLPVAARWVRPLRQFARRGFTTKLGGEVAPGSGRQTDLQGLGPRRFYKEVGVNEVGQNRFAVTIDGSTVKTPRQTPLEVPTAQLATVLASEWDAQGERIRPASMPLMTLVSTAMDIVPTFRGRLIESTVGYVHTDTVCIRPPFPAELADLQEMLMQPIVDHFERKGVVVNVVLGSLMAHQPKATVRYFGEWIEGMDDFTLAGIESATATAKSILVAGAMRDGVLTAKNAVEAARSEEQWQSGVWGKVEGGHDVDDADALVRLSAADVLFRCIEMQPDVFKNSGIEGGENR